MHLQDLKIKWKGKEIEGTIGVPDDLQEAITALTEKEVWESFLAGYLDRQKRRLRRVPRKTPRTHIRVRLNNLNEEQLEGLKALGILRE